MVEGVRLGREGRELKVPRQACYTLVQVLKAETEGKKVGNGMLGKGRETRGWWVNGEEGEGVCVCVWGLACF